MKFQFALLLTLVSLASVGHARAQAAPASAGTGRATLVVTRGQGAEDCPTADELIERVRAIVASGGLQADPRAPADTWIFLELNHDLGRYSAVLQTRGRQQGGRTLSDVSVNCASLAEAVTVTLALLLDAGQTRREREAKPVEVAARIATVPVPTPPRRFAASFGGGVGLGLLAEAAPLGAGSLEVLFGSRLRVGLGGAITLPQRVHYLQGYTELNLAWGAARGCAQALRTKSDIEVMLCVSAMVGMLSGSGKRYDFTHTKRWAWAAVGAGPLIKGPLAAPSFWWLQALAVVPLTRHGFQVTVDGQPHDTFVMSSVAATAAFGMGVHF